jgi:polyisoprenoid-binding protein YceI
MKTKLASKTSGMLFFILILSYHLQATNFIIDKNESNIKWTGKKVTGQHHGTIEFKSGKIETNNNKITGGYFEVNMQTIVCNDLENESWNSKLVTHLKSEDFFSVEKNPVSELKLTNVEKVNDGEYRFTGDLSIKGFTHPVIFNAKVDIKADNLVAVGTISIDRTLYNIKYGSGKFFDSLGNNMIDDLFILDFKLVAKASTDTATE